MISFVKDLNKLDGTRNWNSFCRVNIDNNEDIVIDKIVQRIDKESIIQNQFKDIYSNVIRACLMNDIFMAAATVKIHKYKANEDHIYYNAYLNEFYNILNMILTMANIKYEYVTKNGINLIEQDTDFIQNLKNKLLSTYSTSLEST
jgi:hypothetical protein